MYLNKLHETRVGRWQEKWIAHITDPVAVLAAVMNRRGNALGNAPMEWTAPRDAGRVSFAVWPVIVP